MIVISRLIVDRIIRNGSGQKSYLKLTRAQNNAKLGRTFHLAPSPHHDRELKKASNKKLTSIQSQGKHIQHDSE